MARKAVTSYEQKRDFSKTPEPKFSLKRPKLRHPIYVIQKHKARALHFDMRFEVDGVLLSFAVPKGPSLNPNDKRLAIHTEDHPLDYATFEGVIPKGEYGGGPVMVWDIGTFKNITQHNNKPISLRDAVENGTVEIFIEGERINGAFVFVRLERAGKDAWLLIKMNDEFVNKRANPVRSQVKSVLSGRTFTQIVSDNEERSNKKERKKTPRGRTWN